MYWSKYQWHNISSSAHLLVYADNIAHNIAHTKRDITADFRAIGSDSADMGLAVNEVKSKLMLLSSRRMLHMGAKAYVMKMPSEYLTE